MHKKNSNKGLVLVLTMMASQSFAQYEIKKYTINSGGSKITGGSYEMNSSIGQVDASDTLSGGNYALNGGFWHANNNNNNDLIFTNGFE
ncbi:MAG: hypothetical protein L3J83_12340 [Proteobacteria bacterium]|nr:hypothetical protein [Pseudomonadota bacterium]